MKNIFILHSKEQRRLLWSSKYNSFCLQKEIDGKYINDGKVSGADFWGIEKAKNNGFYPITISITLDEEIKLGNWFITTDSNKIHKSDWIKFRFNNGKKIILTTDKKLIQDGVQQISDEFLNWFIKNSSCEQIKIDSEIKCFDKNDFSISSCIYDTDYSKMVYFPIIPLDTDFLGRTSFDLLKQEAIEEEMAEFDEQKMIEEIAKKQYPKCIVENPTCNSSSDPRFIDTNEELRETFIEGAKWQAERSFSKEEVRQIAEWSFHFYKRNDLSDSELEKEWEERLNKRLKTK